MPMVAYTCQSCRHRFEQVALRGDEDHLAVCPRCGESRARPVKGPDSLFNGIASFSRLSTDTN